MLAERNLTPSHKEPPLYLYSEGLFPIAGRCWETVVVYVPGLMQVCSAKA